LGASRSPELRRQILSSYIGLVKAVVHKFAVASSYGSSVINEDDLAQVGMMGLLDAIDRFDPTRGVKFETYAITRIRGSIQDELRRVDWVPRSVREKVRRADRIVQQLECGCGTTASVEQIATRLAMSVDEYQALMGAHSSIHEFVGPGIESEDIINNLPTDEGTDPFEQLSADEARKILLDAVEELPEQDRLILALYYYEEFTFKEIANVLKLSESRVFQKHASVLVKLRGLMSASV
jgi:RNA polymerase sigma factor for flagellar operon FliA